MDERDCIFCKIVKGEIPCFKIYEDDKVLGFLDLANFVPGHTLLIPKVHFRYIWDITYIGEFYNAAQKLVQHFNKLGYKYVDSLTFGRLVAHAHLHLIPHNDNDSTWEAALTKIGELQQDTNRRLTKEIGEKIAEKFRYQE